MEKLSIRDLTQDVEIFFRGPSGEEVSRVFVLREHSRDDLDRFIDLQIRAGKEIEEAAKAFEIDEEAAQDIVRASFHLVHDPFYKVVAFCLRHPADGGTPPDEQWCREHVGRRKAELVIRTQESLDGLDDPEKKAEAVRSLILASHQAKRISSAGLRLTTESPPVTA